MLLKYLSPPLKLVCSSSGPTYTYSTPVMATVPISLVLHFTYTTLHEKSLFRPLPSLPLPLAQPHPVDTHRRKCFTCPAVLPLPIAI